MMTQKRGLGMTNIWLHEIKKLIEFSRNGNGRSCALKQGLQLHTIWKITTNGYPGCSKYNASCGCHLMRYRRTMQVWRRKKREAKRKKKKKSHAINIIEDLSWVYATRFEKREK